MSVAECVEESLGGHPLTDLQAQPLLNQTLNRVKLRGQRSHLAFTLVEIMVVVAFIGMLTVLAIPSFARARRTAILQGCIENQRIIYDGVVRYELDMTTSLQPQWGSPGSIASTLTSSGYVKSLSSFKCPNQRSYSYRLLYVNSSFSNTVCWTSSGAHPAP